MTDTNPPSEMEATAMSSTSMTPVQFTDNLMSNTSAKNDSHGENNNNKGKVSISENSEGGNAHVNNNDNDQAEICPNDQGDQQQDTFSTASNGTIPDRDQESIERNNWRRTRLEYQKNYPISRFSRKWKRQEVQGLCCLSVEVLCLVALAILSLNGMGYFGDLADGGHVPHTFSWKILREFFTYEEVGSNTKDCLHQRNTVKRSLGRRPSGRIFKTVDNDEIDYEIESNENDRELFELLSPQHENEPSGDSRDCDYKKNRHSTDWLLKMLSANFMAATNTFTSGLFFASLAVRRRKGLQVILLIPSFLCFFMSIFQQIPTTFHYNYVNLLIRDEMRAAIAQSSSVYSVNPVLEETQIHMQCCGIELPSTWDRVLESRREGVLPGSCCNTTAYECKGKPTVSKAEAWSVGCYHVVYDRVHTYERWTLFILGFKIIAEVGIFCALSDLTRYDYPVPEVFENSRCEFRDYVVKCKGIARLKGVTKDGRIVVVAGLWLSWRLIPSRTDLVNGLVLYLKNDLNQTKGSVEVLKRHNLATFLHEDIQVDLTQKNKGLFVFTLT